MTKSSTKPQPKSTKMARRLGVVTPPRKKKTWRPIPSAKRPQAVQLAKNAATALAVLNQSIPPARVSSTHDTVDLLSSMMEKLHDAGLLRAFMVAVRTGVFSEPRLLFAVCHHDISDLRPVHMPESRDVRCNYVKLALHDSLVSLPKSSRLALMALPVVTESEI